MAIEKELDIKVNTGDSDEKLDKLAKGVKKVGDESVNTKKELDKSEKSLKETNASVGDLAKKLDESTGGSLTFFRTLKSGLSSGVKGFKNIRTAIALSGIGALVLVVVSLQKAFTSSEEGQNKFAKIMSVIGVVVGNVSDILADFGESVISIGTALIKLTQGDLKGASKAFKEFKSDLKDASDGITDFASKTQKEAKDAIKVAADRAKAEKIDRALLVSRSKLESEIAQLRLQSREEEKYGARERAEFLKQAQKLEDELLDKELESKKLKFEAQKLENTFSKSNKEALQKEAELEAQLNNVKTRRLNSQRQVQRELNTLNRQVVAQENQKVKEEETRLSQIEKIRADFFKKQQQQRADDEFKKLELEKESSLESLNRLKGTEEEKEKARVQIQNFYTSKRKEIEEKNREKEKEYQDKRSLEQQEFELTQLETELERSEKRKEIIDNEQLKLEEKHTKDLEIYAEGTQARIDAENEYLSAKQNLGNQEIAIDKKIASEKKKNAENEKVLNKAVANAKINNTKNVLTNVSALLKKGSAEQKTVAVTQAVLSTYQGINKALAETTDTTPTQTLRFLNAAAVGIAGFANVKKILSTKPSSTSAPTTAPVTTPTAPSIEPSQITAPSFDITEGNATSQLNKSIQGLNSKPQKNYVVSTEISTEQSLDRQIEQSSII